MWIRAVNATDKVWFLTPQRSHSQCRQSATATRTAASLLPHRYVCQFGRLQDWPGKAADDHMAARRGCNIAQMGDNRAANTCDTDPASKPALDARSGAAGAMSGRLVRTERNPRSAEAMPSGG